jgi:NAD(P)-dependent dehydrogenase (short-subunit alcohol dehydrogenase family)
VVDESRQTVSSPTFPTVYVTGGASGLGAAVCRAVAASNRRPIVLDRRGSPDNFESVTVDLAESKAAEAAVIAASREFAPPDAVVTCAGVDAPGRFDQVSGADWDRVVAVNLLGSAAVIRASLPHLRRVHGRVVTVASTLGHRAVSDATAYCASKFGVVGLTRALQAECKEQVGVTLLTPGGMWTAFFDGREPQYAPPADAKLCQPEDVADAVLFALTRPPGCEVKELVVASPAESSWP